MTTDKELADVIAELEYETERLREAISYLPKVPTQPYEKELAKENERLKQALSVAREGLELTAIPVNMIHTVHPKCFCSQCKQREALTKLDELLGGEK